MVAATKFAADTATPPTACPEKKGLIPICEGNSEAVDTTPAVAMAPHIPQIASPKKVMIVNSSVQCLDISAFFI